MSIIYETFGDFNAGTFSYRLLLSKKTLGSITLTDTNLSFESQIDKVVFQIKLSDIQDFFLKYRLSIPLIELITIHGTHYSLFPLRRKSTVFGSSLGMTEDLFRHLSRLIFIKDQVVLFDATGIFNPGSPKSISFKESSSKGHIFLTENNILFRSFQQGGKDSISVSDIKQIMMNAEGSTTYTTIETFKGDLFSFSILKARRKKFRQDQFKTEKFYDILNQVKMYKDSEKVGSLNITCSSCGNSIEKNMNHCPFCGNEI